MSHPNDTSVATRTVANLSPHDQRELMPSQPEADFAALKADIGARGIQVPLCVTDDNRVLCGHHRLRAAVDLGLTEVPVIVRPGLDRLDEIRHMVDDNLLWRHWTPSQRAAIATRPEIAEVYQKISEAARQRQVRGGKDAGRNRPRKKVQETVPEPIGTRATDQSRDILGRAVGVSGKLIDAARLVWAKAPDRMPPVLQGKPKPTLSALARELRAPAPPPPTADPRAFFATEVDHAGQCQTALSAIIQLSAKSVGFVWTIDAGLLEGYSIVQKVADIWDETGMVQRNSRLGQFVSEIIDWAESETIYGVELLGLSRRFEVSFVDGERRVLVLPNEDEPPEEPSPSQSLEEAGNGTGEAG